MLHLRRQVLASQALIHVSHLAYMRILTAEAEAARVHQGSTEYSFFSRKCLEGCLSK